jgi:hypothetical protein
MYGLNEFPKPTLSSGKSVKGALLMRKLTVSVSLTCMLLSSGEATALGAGTGKGNSVPVVIVELFTSEGCSSCPPADKLLSETIRRYPHAVAALSEHVDYWDYLGWRDPNSSALFTQRQQAYCRRLSTNSVYTPQLVVGGVMQGVGSDAGVVDRFLDQALKDPPKPIQLMATDDKATQKLNVTVGFDQSFTEESELNVAVTEDGVFSKVARGENSGRRLSHDAVTRLLWREKVSKLKFKDGQAKLQLNISPAWNLENLNVIAFVQQPGPGRITFSGKTRINER